jgi:thioesterase domain-containing protein/acyl carrier protein
VAPRDALELRLVQIWEDVLSTRPIGVQHSFFEIGGHSLLAVRLMARVQQELGRQLPVATLFQNATIERLASVLRREPEAAGPSSSLVTLQRGEPGRRPLFLVHPAGGDVLCYVDLVRRLGVEQPCFGLRAAGLDGEQPPRTEVEAMAAHYSGLIRTAQAEGPYLLGGWSIGGVVAFEIARQLRDQGEEVTLLALIDSHAPDGSDQELPDDLTLLAGLAMDLGLRLDRLPIDREHLQRLAPDDRLAYLLEEAKQARAVPPDLELAQLRRLFDVYRSNARAVMTYCPRPYSGPVTLFAARDRREGIEASLGWSTLAAQGLAVHEVSGDHLSIVREPNVGAVAGEIARVLGEIGSVGQERR